MGDELQFDGAGDETFTFLLLTAVVIFALGFGFCFYNATARPCVTTPVDFQPGKFH
jgi:hypothetical protein